MENHEQHQLVSGLQDYLPLIIILGFCLILGFFHSGSMMYGFMGYFFIFLSMFKLFDLPGFVEGFSSYDWVSQKFPAYGYAYPFIELGLGLAYIREFLPFFLNIITIVIMCVSAAGVLRSLLLRQKISCACLGTVLKVPLSTVSLLENIGMALMAGYMLFGAN